MKRALLLELDNVLEHYRSVADSTASGVVWANLILHPTNGVTHDVTRSVYSGDAGVVLFLQEAASRHSRKATGLVEAAVKGLIDLSTSLSEPPAFLTGSIGVDYVLNKSSRTDPGYQGHFCRSDLSLKRFDLPEETDLPCDYLTGIAGRLVGLMHIYSECQHNQLFDLIDATVSRLLDKVLISDHFMCWDREDYMIHSLCGLSHGASGLAFAFLELGRYYCNPAFYWLAQQAMNYENSHFDSRKHNWPDYRRGLWTQDDMTNHHRHFNNGDRSFFTTPADFSAWCHGAPGIGLTRLRAWQLLGDEEYFRDFELAVEKVRETDLTYNPNRTFTLCHGSCGNAELLLEGYRVTGRREYLEDAYRIAEFAIRQKEELGVYISGYAQAGMQEDLSLFMGTAGIGYFFLRLLDPSVPSILLPKIDAPPIKVDSKYKNINISLPELKRRVCSRAYGRTLVAMGDNLPSFSGSSDENIQSELQKVENAASLSTAVTVKEALQYEKTVRELDMSIESFALVHAELLFGRYEGPLTEDLVLKLSDRVRLVTSQWNWVSEDLTKELQNEPSEVGILLQALPEKVNQVRLSDFAYAVLSLFDEPVSLSDAWKALADKIEMETREEESEVHRLFLEQVKQAVDARILVEVKAKPEN